MPIVFNRQLLRINLRSRGVTVVLIRSATLVLWEVGTGRDALPRGNFLMPIRKFVAKARECDPAENEMQGRFRRVCGGYDRLNRFLRISRLLAGLRFQILAGLACRCRIIGQLSPSKLAGSPEEVGAKGPRLDHGHAHSEWLHFSRQCLAESFHGKLCRVVETPSRRADQSADGGQIEDMSAAALTKMRQEGAGTRMRP